MDLQRGARTLLIVLALAAMTGCAKTARPDGLPPVPYRLVASSERSELGGVRVYESQHYLLCTTLHDPTGVGPILTTLEAAYEQYVTVTGVRPPAEAPRMMVYVFQTPDEWAAFTRRRTGQYAPLYLKLDRGGYTFDKFCVVREQGVQDTLTVLAHEGLHLFIATHFLDRPPPFVEEGLASRFETVRRHDDGRVRIDINENPARSARLAKMLESGQPLPPLRDLVAMHAGNVVGLPGTEVDAFYAQAWAFVRFLDESGDPELRAGYRRLMADAASRALSSGSLRENPTLVERYLGRELESLEPAFRAYVERLAQ